MIEYEKKEIEYMVNALRAYSVPRDAPRDKAAWLAGETTKLADLRRDTWIPRSKECVAYWEGRGDAERARWHAQ